MHLISITRQNTKIPVYVAKERDAALKAAEKVALSCLEGYSTQKVVSDKIFDEEINVNEFKIS